MLLGMAVQVCSSVHLPNISHVRLGKSYMVGFPPPGNATRTREAYPAVIEQRLQELGWTLPPPQTPVANYVRAVRTGHLLFLAGHLPVRDGQVVYRGKVGRDMDVETGYQAAQLVMLNCLATLKDELGDLDRVKRIVKVLGMVNSDAEFTDQPKVINGASDLLIALYGERGRHARSAVGMSGLPMGVAVEIEMIVEIE